MYFFSYLLSAIKTLAGAGVDAWPAVVGDLLGQDWIRCLAAHLDGMGIRTRIETEYLERYPFVMANLKRRGGETAQAQAERTGSDYPMYGLR